MKKSNSRYAFTLVELIITITILAILSTISYLSFQNYVKDSRNTSRIDNINSIEKWLSLFYEKTWKYPIPEKFITLNSSWTLIWYQGVFGKQSAILINMPDSPLDPLDKNYFTYVSNADLSAYQIVWFFENQWTSLNDISSRNIQSFGNELWALFLTNWINSNKPLQEIYDQNSFTWIDIKNFNWILTNWENVGNLKAIFNNNFDNNIVWTWWTLSNLENSFKNKMQILMQSHCPSWWKNLGELFIKTWALKLWLYIETKKEKLYVCEWNIFPINNNIIMHECNNNSNNIWELKIKSWALPVYTKINNVNYTFYSCNLNYFSKSHEVIMTYCPFWWEDLWEIKPYNWVLASKMLLDNTPQSFKLCKKTK